MLAIQDKLVDFENDIAWFVSIAAQLELEKIIISGFDRFLEINMSIQQQESIMKKAPEKGLFSFLKRALGYKCRQPDVPIRGPDGLAWDFYQLNGAAGKLAPFLFGTASQHRN